MVNFLATRVPELLAGVPFYGGAGPVEDVKNIKAAMLVQHGGNDKRLVDGWPAHEAALKAANVQLRGLHLPERRARLQQRHDPALRRGLGEAGVGPHHRPLQQVPALSGGTGLAPILS